MKDTYYIGIDPGKNGAYAIIYRGCVKWINVMPLAGKDIDWHKMAEYMCQFIVIGKSVALIEKVSAMPGQGVKSMFTFGFVTGGVHGVLGALGIPRYMVTPQAWKKEILVGTPKDKDAAIDYVTRVYPQVSLLATPRSTKPHNGLADAICIAEYASRHF